MEQQILREIDELEIDLLRSIAAFFAQRELPFDPLAYLAQASIDLHMVAQEATFFGAERFPVKPDSSNLVSMPRRPSRRARGRSSDAGAKRPASGRR